MEKYRLSNLAYGYKDLEPYISEEVLTLHHNKHHAGYVNAANALLDKIDEARKNNADLDFAAFIAVLTTSPTCSSGDSVNPHPVSSL